MNENIEDYGICLDEKVCMMFTKKSPRKWGKVSSARNYANRDEPIITIKRKNTHLFDNDTYSGGVSEVVAVVCNMCDSRKVYRESKEKWKCPFCDIDA